MAASSPAAAKKAGRLVRGFDEDLWERERFALVVEGSVAQVRRRALSCAGYLLGTGDRVLVEAAPLDRIWGIGLAADDERAERPGELAGAESAGVRADGGAGAAAGGLVPLVQQRRPVRKGVVPCRTGRRMRYVPGARGCPADQGRTGRGVWCGASQGAGTSSSRSDSGVSATPRGAVPGVADPAKIRRTPPNPGPR